MRLNWTQWRKNYFPKIWHFSTCSAVGWYVETVILTIIYFFIARFFQTKKKRSKIERLKFKTIRFDKKKWKDNLVLHYLISKWIFFLITFRRHQDLQILISPKSLILQTKKFLQNDARIQKRLKRLGFCRKV